MLVKGRNLWVVVSLLAIFGATVPIGQARRKAAQSPSRAAMPTNVPSPILPVVPTVAPGYRAPTLLRPQPTSPALHSSRSSALSLQDAIGMALVKNPNLAVSASNMRVAGYQVVETKGAFDVRLQVQPPRVSRAAAAEHFLLRAW